jgi:2,3-bisphosphoglycerate-dependent phosphoglycerate mutase
MKLALLRHGESEWNRENRFTGWTDIDLSEKGRSEAALAGIVMRDAGLAFNICHTSYLKRAIHTLDLALETMNSVWLPVVKTWRLNERHYGALQGLNKAETAEKYGQEQVNIWRRSFDVQPPPLPKGDARRPELDVRYSEEPRAARPLTESLRDTVARALPYFEDVVKPDMLAGKRVLVVAHGNSLRALVKHLDNLSDSEITRVNIPTGIPLVYEFDKDFNVIKKAYLGNEAEIAKRIQAATAVTARP